MRGEKNVNYHVIIHWTSGGKKRKKQKIAERDASQRPALILLRRLNG